MSLFGSIGIGPLRVGASTRGGGGRGDLQGTLMVLAIGLPIFFIVKYWYVTLAIVAFAAILAVIGFSIYELEERRAGKAQKKADIIARAEGQHARLMDGDESALYGNYPPADL